MKEVKIYFLRNGSYEYSGILQVSRINTFDQYQNFIGYLKTNDNSSDMFFRNVFFNENNRYHCKTETDDGEYFFRGHLTSLTSIDNNFYEIIMTVKGKMSFKPKAITEGV